VFPLTPPSLFEFDDQRGVSPVIGTILMIAVTVILAAFIGTFVFGFAGEVAQDDPLAAFQMSQDGTTAVLTHTGGDTLDGEDVYIVSESGGWLGNYAGTDGQACDTTTSTVKPGTECQILGAPSGDVSVVWRSDSRSKILFEGQVFERGRSSMPTSTPTPIPAPTPTSAESVETVNTEGVDTQSSQIELVIENTGSDPVTVVNFTVDATAISNDIWIDDGNNPEFETTGASDNGNANDAGRKDDSFLADGTTYRLEENNGENATLASTDDSVTVTFRAFGPGDKWIDDSDALELVDNEADADVVIYLGLSDGSTAELYLQVV